MLAQDCVGFSTESLTAQEATQFQANQDRCSPFTTNSYFPFRGSCEAGLHSHSAQHLPYLPGLLLPHKCSPASITHPPTDKGMKRPFCIWLSVENGTVSFRVLPASFLESHQKHKPSSPHRWIKMIMAETENMAHLSAWRNSASLSNLKMLNSKKKEAKENSITRRLIIQCMDYSGFLLCSPLPLVPVIRPFHCSLAGRRKKERRGKVELAEFSIYEGRHSNYWLQRFFGGERGSGIGGCGTVYWF